MKQMVARFNSSKSDVDLLISNEDEQIWKSIAIEKFYKLLGQYLPKDMKEGKPKVLDPQIIAASQSCTVVRQPDHKRIVTYGHKAYRINFPNAVYFIHHSETKINKIEAYTYIKWQGVNTSLYLMPMPNMTSSERMCIGTADRKIKKGDVVQALENVLDASYTHDRVDNLKKSTSTIKWFTHLKKQSVTVSDLKKPKCKLRDLVE